MKIPKGHGFNLTGGVVLGITLLNGDTLQGIFLGIVDKRRVDNLATEISIRNNSHSTDDSEFLLLQLTCAYSFFSVGSVVAINVANITVIGPGNNLCAPSLD